MILAVTDKVGRIQYNRVMMLARLLPHLDIHVRALDNWQRVPESVDVVYYAHFSLFDKKKIKGNKATLASVTSHKSKIGLFFP